MKHQSIIYNDIENLFLKCLIPKENDIDQEFEAQAAMSGFASDEMITYNNNNDINKLDKKYLCLLSQQLMK